jgi:hypothetical protein
MDRRRSRSNDRQRREERAEQMRRRW